MKTNIMLWLRLYELSYYESALACNSNNVPTGPQHSTLHPLWGPHISWDIVSRLPKHDRQMILMYIYCYPDSIKNSN